jgi:hypothetical protein
MNKLFNQFSCKYIIGDHVYFRQTSGDIIAIKTVKDVTHVLVALGRHAQAEADIRELRPVPRHEIETRTNILNDVPMITEYCVRCKVGRTYAIKGS